MGNCINLFDQNGNCQLKTYNDVSQFAQSLQQDCISVSSQQFFNKVKFNNEFPINKKMIFLHDLKRDLYIAYDQQEDVHYIYE